MYATVRNEIFDFIAIRITFENNNYDAFYKREKDCSIFVVCKCFQFTQFYCYKQTPPPPPPCNLIDGASLLP